MPRKFIKRYLPNHDTIREHQHLRIIRPLLQDPNLLHLNRRSVSGAFAVGLFIAFVPIPFQMLLAAIVAIIIRVNLPLSVSLVWISNPITMAPLFYFAYKVGAWILDIPAKNIKFELSWDWLSQSLDAVWQPLLLGCFLVGAISALIGSLTIRALWRIRVKQTWNRRKLKRLLKKRAED